MTHIHTLTAFNTATESENKIHDDAVASRFGFTGGLVPGVDVFGYMAHVPLSLWGRDWLTGGGMHARFLKPVYDGDAVTATGEAEGEGRLTLGVSARGVHCATGAATLRETGPAPDILPHATPGDYATRPKASPDSLKIGDVLGTYTDTYTRRDGAEHMGWIREINPLLEGGRLANPAFLLRRANYILDQQVKLGPWIHTESRIRLHDVVSDGETFETRAVVVDNVEKGGHLIVSFDFTVSVGDRLAMSGRHWAIYEPRQVRQVA